MLSGNTTGRPSNVSFFKEKALGMKLLCQPENLV